MFEDTSYAFGYVQPPDEALDAMAAAAAQMATRVNSSGSNSNNVPVVDDDGKIKCNRLPVGGDGSAFSMDGNNNNGDDGLSLSHLHANAREVASMNLDGGVHHHHLGFNFDQAAHELLLQNHLMQVPHHGHDVVDTASWAAASNADGVVGMQGINGFLIQQEADAALHQQHQQLFPHTAVDPEQQHKHNHLAFQQESYDLNGALGNPAVPPGALNHYSIDSTTFGGTAPDLLNLLHLSNGTQGLPFAAGAAGGSPGKRFPLDIFGDLSAAAGTGKGTGAGSVLYDPTTVAAPLYFGYGTPGGLQTPQTHLLRDLFQTMPSSCGMFCEDEIRDAAGEGGGTIVGGGGMFLQEEDGLRQFDNPVFEFRRGAKVGEKPNYPTEKHRRKQMKDKYNDLMALIPNPSKTDRASVVLDAIEYIQELQREMGELKLLIEKKRFGRAAKRPKIEGADQHPHAANGAPADGVDGRGTASGFTPGATDMESTTVRSTTPEGTGQLQPAGSAVTDRDSGSQQLYASALRSTWLQRRSRETSVDVRIVDDETNIKLTQKKKANCLLLASRALDDLQLDVAHVSGGFIGEHYIFMFNTKIIEGSSVYASAIATKLLEVMDRTYQPPTYPPGY